MPPLFVDLGTGNIQAVFCNSQLDQSHLLVPHFRCPPDGWHQPNPVWPKDFKIDTERVMRDNVANEINSSFAGDKKLEF